jgi:hypothetical protein
MGIDTRNFFKILVVLTPLLYISGFFFAAYTTPDVLFVFLSLPILLWLQLLFDASKRVRQGSTNMKLASTFLVLTYCGFGLEILLLAYGDKSFLFPVFAVVGFAILAQAGFFLVVLSKAPRARRAVTLGNAKS